MKTMTWLTLALAVAVSVAGCRQDVFGSPPPATTAEHVTLTEHAAASALVAVAAGGTANGQLLQVVGATAQPLEHLNIVVPGSRSPAIVAAAAPAPAAVQIPARPSPPPTGATSYQEAEYQRQQSRWNGELAAGQRAVLVRTTQATTNWVRPLLTRAAGAGAAATGNLMTECALATSVLSGIGDQAGTRFAGRVVLLGVASLQGMPPPGELDGDDVIVITPFLPAASAAAAAQQNLLTAGAARAAVLGPEATQAQLDQLVSDGLTARQVTETVSGSALFANDSMTLLPAAARVLTPLLAQLRRPGATAVINGYASAPGTPGHNLALSQGRAEAVALFLEAHDVSAAALSVVGHGAANLVGPGSSGDNRRVVVVLEEPA
jgi:outer membrane protein OmpA-like peptidoglycan-associated protein